MKQLEPILKYHFWILLVVGLIMAFSGWWMTTGQMKAAITSRKEAIQKAADLLPKGEVASAEWAVKLKAINDAQERLVRETREGLYARQKERMIWPEVIREVAAKLKYREEFTDVIHHINYRDNYDKEVMRVYSIPRPIGPNNSNGVISFSMGQMPHRVWNDHTPTSKQMWDSIEDLWLIEPILQAILETNGGPKATKYDAVVLSIEHLKLHGGDRSKIGQTGGSGGGGAPAGGFGGGGVTPSGDDSDFGRSGGGAGNLDVNPLEVFGDPGTSAADAGNAMPAGLDAAGGEGRQNQFDDPGRRYIDDDKAAIPYRTRGFKLTVVMDHRKVPDLYGQLTSSERSPWPIQIVRLHVGRLADAGGVRNDALGREGQGVPFGAFGARPAVGNINAVESNPIAELMENPFLARVTLAGIITLYNEPEKKDLPPPANSPVDSGAATQPVADAKDEDGKDGTADDPSADPAMSEDSASEPSEDSSESGDDPEEKTMSDDAPDGDAPESEPSESSDAPPE